MRLLRVGDRGAERPVLEDQGRHFGLSGVLTDIDAEFWSTGRARVAAALVDGSLPEVDISGKRIGAPVVRPGAVVCIGQNYAAHAAESGATPPSQPIMFLKPSSSVAGPYDDVTIPVGSLKTDWEVELAVVIGATAAFLGSVDDAAACIGGYLLANDLSERRYQLEDSGGQWSKGKSLKGFCPIGPVLVTADEIDPSSLRLQSWVNGEPRQDSTTADLIFGVHDLVHHLSHFMELEPGDLILTGTPAGVALSGRFPYLRGGDVVELEIEGLGRQRQEYVQA